MTQKRKATSTSVVRPTDRQPMKDWLIERLNEERIEGLKWEDVQKGTFRIPWKHASGHAYSTTDACVFKEWAQHTGRINKYSESKRWKANFRCALNSLPNVVELTQPGNKKGPKAFKLYQFVDLKPSERVIKNEELSPADFQECGVEDVPAYIQEETVETSETTDENDVTSTADIQDKSHRRMSKKTKRKRSRHAQENNTDTAEQKIEPASKKRRGKARKEENVEVKESEYPAPATEKGPDNASAEIVVLSKHVGGCRVIIHQTAASMTSLSREDSLDAAVSDYDDELTSLPSVQSVMSDEEVVEMILDSESDVETLTALPWTKMEFDYDMSGSSSPVTEDLPVPVPNLAVSVDVGEFKLNPKGGILSELKPVVLEKPAEVLLSQLAVHHGSPAAPIPTLVDDMEATDFEDSDDNLSFTSSY